MFWINFQALRILSFLTNQLRSENLPKFAPVLMITPTRQASTA